ncbi:MAG: hypothetical protein ACLP9L_06905, partial [Thermoguttaceae bacterium]
CMKCLNPSREQYNGRYKIGATGCRWLPRRLGLDAALFARNGLVMERKPARAYAAIKRAASTAAMGKATIRVRLACVFSIPGLLRFTKWPGGLSMCSQKAQSRLWS